MVVVGTRGGMSKIKKRGDVLVRHCPACHPHHRPLRWDSAGWSQERIARLETSNDDGLVSATEHEANYTVAWGSLCDHTRVSTTPCAPLKQSSILTTTWSHTHPKASRILARPARRGSPLQSNERAPNGHKGESKRTPE